MPPITCHVLDTTRGKPGGDIVVAIYRIANLPKDEDSEISILDNQPFGLAKTNSDGRIKDWIFHPEEDLSGLGIENREWKTLHPGIYKIRFQTSKYFKQLSDDDKEKDIVSDSRTFFPFVDIMFTVSDPPDDHYHIPLLLANHSYTTYRGS